MTLNDLRQEIAALGFENEIAADATFLSAVRRALISLYNERSICRNLKILRHPLYPKIHTAKIEHKAGESIRIYTEGAAYSFRVSGCGSYSVLLDEIRNTYNFNTPYGEFSGIIFEGSYIEFSGELSYTVYDLCFFEEDNASENEIPIYKDEAVYKMALFVDDFLAFDCLPTDAEGNEIAGAHFVEESLLLPYSYSGEINIRYRQAPPKISADKLDEPIPIPKDIEHLPALLSASYIWLDDDPERAAHYLSLYREGMAAAKLYGAKKSFPVYKDVLRWA